jgi:hypothetical protein
MNREQKEREGKATNEKEEEKRNGKENQQKKRRNEMASHKLSQIRPVSGCRGHLKP